MFEADALPAEENVSKQLKGYIVDPLKKVAEKAFVEVIRVGVGAAHLGKVSKQKIADDHEFLESESTFFNSESG